MPHKEKRGGKKELKEKLNVIRQGYGEREKEKGKEHQESRINDHIYKGRCR